MAETGKQFDRFLLQDLLRQDLWGEVYLAFDPKLVRQVSIHILAKQLAENPQVVERYAQVARTIIRWRQPGIAKLFDFGQSDNRVYMVQDYCPGESLAQACESLQAAGKWISLSEAVSLTLEVCQALEYAHQRNLTHGNLIAENILLCAGPGTYLPYQPILINLGLGLPGDDQVSSDPTRLQEAVAADIRAAGRLLSFLVCGEKSLPLRDLRPDLPHSLERVILRAISTNPADSFETIHSFSQALADTLAVARRISTTPPQYPVLGSLDPKPKSVLQEAIPAAMLHILLPDQSMRSEPLHRTVTVIGRDDENDLVLDLTSISRRHARIEFDGKNYSVTDLHSTNGTYLGELRLLPDTPHIWQPEENLRLGDIWLRLERADEPAEPEKPAAVPLEIVQEDLPTLATQVKFSPDNGPVGAYSIETNLMVTPGKSITVPVLLYNRSTKDDIFTLDVQGVPVEWMPNRLASVSLPANGQREVKLVFHPPHTPASRAGRHTILLRVASQNDPRHNVELRLALAIAAFSQVSSEIQPKNLRSGSSGNLIVRNMGNMQETFNLSWEDRNHELRFEPKRANAVVPAGETVQVGFQVSRAQPVWFGSEKINSFTVNVAPQSGEAQTHTGSLISQALIPRWALISLISLCIVLSCVLVIFANQLTGTSPNARQTDQAKQTIEAIVQQGTQLAITQTANFILGGNVATLQAATATAMWREADSDADGLTNAQEIILATRPDNPDSDADGLKDGEEVNTYRTYPLTPDSDGDGLKDGDEVLKRTNPLNRDSDGDGVDDLVDFDPLNNASATVPTTPTHTPTTTSTATITPTVTPPANIANLSLFLTNNTTTAIPGTNTAYTLQVRNNSLIPVNNIQVIDTFPAILLNPTWNCVASAGSACQTGNGLGNIDTRLNLIPAGTATFTISASINPTASGLMINSASFKLPDGMTDPDVSDNQAMDTDGLVPTVNLEISLTDNRATAEPGDLLVYTISAVNHGPSAVFGLVITDFFPDTLTNISWTCTPTPGSVCGVSGVKTGNINTDVNLSPNGVATFSINATVQNSASGVLSNSAGLISPLSPTTNNKTATDTTTIVPKADLGVTVSAPATAAPTVQVTYTITVTNNGPSNVSGLTLVDELAAGVTFSSSDPALPVCTLSGNTLTCNLGDLAAGEKRVVKLVVTTPALPGMITNLVNITASQTDPILVNNQAATDILIF